MRGGILGTDKAHGASLGMNGAQHVLKFTMPLSGFVIH